MSNQEMQFADPDWKPTQPLAKQTSSQEQETFIPQPINADPREQSKWRTAPPSPPQQEGYAGLRPYAGPTPQQMQAGDVRQRQYRRRGRGPWLWIILAIIIFSLTSRGFGALNSPSSGPNSFDHNPFGHKPFEQMYDYTVNGHPTIKINDTNGAVQINVGQSNTEVSIQASNEGNINDNSNGIQVNQSPDGNTINASVQGDQQGPVDLIVTVPKSANLQLQTDSGPISVNGVDGQMTLTTGSGSIDVTVPGDSAFHVDASTNSGSIDANAFPSVHMQNNNHVSGDVGGSSPGATMTLMTLHTDSGAINLYQG
jgi:hypothetical protein